MDSSLVEAEMNRIKNLRPYKNKSEEFLRKKAEENIVKRESETIASRFEDESDKKIANKLYSNYLEQYPFIDSLGDLSTLADLVYSEILKQKVETQINKSKDLRNGEFLISEKNIETLQSLQDQILKLKNQLGIHKKEEEKQEDLNGLQELQKRFQKYIQANRNEFTCKCANCGSMLLLRRRVANFDCLKHPNFFGTFLYNIEIIKDVKENKISKEQAAKYLQTSPDYIDWCINHEKEIIENI